jgi:hypothetical protein
MAGRHHATACNCVPLSPSPASHAHPPTHPHPPTPTHTHTHRRTPTSPHVAVLAAHLAMQVRHQRAVFCPGQRRWSRPVRLPVVPVMSCTALLLRLSIATFIPCGSLLIGLATRGSSGRLFFPLVREFLAGWSLVHAGAVQVVRRLHCVRAITLQLFNVTRMHVIRVLCIPTHLQAKPTHTCVGVGRLQPAVACNMGGWAHAVAQTLCYSHMCAGNVERTMRTKASELLHLRYTYASYSLLN